MEDAVLHTSIVHNIFYVLTSCAFMMSCRCIRVLKSLSRHIQTTRTISRSLKFWTLLTMSVIAKTHLMC